VIEVPEDRPVDLGGGVRCRIMSTHGDDTLMTVTDGHEVCVNANDALHSAPADVQERFAARLRELHPVIDYFWCGYGIASHFPNCYVLPGKDPEATTAFRQAHFNRQWARLASMIQPRFAFPFAADVVFLEDGLFWANEVTHNSERPTDVFRSLHPSCSTLVSDPAPGFSIEGGRVLADVLRKPLVASRLRTEYAAEIVRANRHGVTEGAEVGQVAPLLRQNLERCRQYLESGKHDYRVLIRFRSSSAGLLLTKEGRDITITTAGPDVLPTCDLIYTTRLAYLRWALTRKYGHEILFVGSGGVFEYLDNCAVAMNLHQEVIHLLRGEVRPARVKPGLVAHVKRLVKWALRVKQSNLYDLRTWTVMRR
jgi:hypothetical protein